MSEELKPKAWLNNNYSNYSKIEIGGNGQEEVVAVWEWKSTPLYDMPQGYSLVKNPSLVEKGQPMPQTLDEWHHLAAGYDKAMLADKAEISRLKSELNNAKQKLAAYLRMNEDNGEEK